MKRLGLLGTAAISLALTTALAIAQTGPSPSGGSTGPTSGSAPAGAAHSPAGGGAMKEHAPAQGKEIAPDRGAQNNAPNSGKQIQTPASGSERAGRNDQPTGGESSTARKGEEQKSTTQGNQPSNTDKANARTDTKESAKESAKSPTPEQKTKITEAVRSQHVRAETNINVSVRAGVVVPESVHFYRVPPVIVEVYPEYRDYEYFVYNDEIVIVEPGTRRIVVIIPYA